MDMDSMTRRQFLGMLIAAGASVTCLGCVGQTSNANTKEINKDENNSIIDSETKTIRCTITDVKSDSFELKLNADYIINYNYEYMSIEDEYGLTLELIYPQQLKNSSSIIGRKAEINYKELLKKQISLDDFKEYLYDNKLIEYNVYSGYNAPKSIIVNMDGIIDQYGIKIIDG